jgi:hypothetical protein
MSAIYIGGRLPTHLLAVRKSATMAAWFVVIEQRLHIDRPMGSRGRSGYLIVAALLAVVRPHEHEIATDDLRWLDHRRE